MTRLVAMGMVLGLFAVGVLTGGFSVQLFHDFHGHGGERRAVRNGHHAHFMERLERDLELTPEQRAKFEEMHERHRGMAERFLLGHGKRRRGGGPHGPPPPPPED